MCLHRRPSRVPQNFTEILRALGYPRLVAVDNFRQPHFALVADILFWMTTRYEPNANISDDIDTETERVEFVTSVARLFATKAGIKLNCKRIYAADGRAVKEVRVLSVLSPLPGLAVPFALFVPAAALFICLCPSLFISLSLFPSLFLPPSLSLFLVSFRRCGSTTKAYFSAKLFSKLKASF